MSDTTAQTRYGAVRGYTDGSISEWKGIPFAAPPVGALRFRAPEPPKAWLGTRSAFEFGPASLQPDEPLLTSFTGRTSLQQSEDCLYLNIWSPGADDHQRPVLVWIHGGAYVTGSGSVAWYDGTSFTTTGDVVVVTVNYRLGVFGFLHLQNLFGQDFAGSGNLGLLDQIAALRWVKENIAAFGGDPTRVTVFGESAGAGSIGALLSIPAARGLFQQAIMESGSGSLGVHSAKTASDTAARVLTAAGVQPGDVEALQTVPADRLLEAATSLGRGMHFGPVIDGMVLSQHPLQALEHGSARDIPILTGVNLEEYRLFTLADPDWPSADEAGQRKRVRAVLGPVPDGLIDFYLHHMPGKSMFDRMVLLLTYGVFVRGMLQTVENQVRQGAPTWVYRFDWESPVLGGKLGACHAQEIPFVFNNLNQLGVQQFTGDSPQRDPIAKQMHQAWIAFAHTGNPNHGDQPEWPAYDIDNRATMAFGVNTHLEFDPYGPERKVWADVAREG